ncbi:lipoyl(octanoyl) transferase LipB [Bartonella tamiae]|uniref:Octanoyltransferase n=1 Tax=Bartonella tamiae Th239 TaxID=1094558 RepID=J1JVW1_9HYPH|nr:lipoyl(octanoyl) transferase LipB [Bartonella tamiae]EJF88705.1 octanoyltransferase [Bartonella tamiae Th239]EJF95045.1 octanoyltransferase [Bartonella tamiae Th307]
MTRQNVKHNREYLNQDFKTSLTAPPVEWLVSDKLIDYPEALSFMTQYVEEIAKGNARERIWLLEHPPLYTAGTSAQRQDLLLPDRFPVFEAGRGGEFTYHGPGQRVVYIMLDLKKRKQDVRAFVSALEEWIIQTLAQFNIKGERREDRVGVWVVRTDRPSSKLDVFTEDKIAAIGIRLRKWVSFHGISINVEPNLNHYNGIVPCGLADYGVTSLVDLGLPVTLHNLDTALKIAFEKIFGATEIIY